MTELLAGETRCTLCSLACALGFVRTPGGTVTAAYPNSKSSFVWGASSVVLTGSPCPFSSPTILRFPLLFRWDQGLYNS